MHELSCVAGRTQMPASIRPLDFGEPTLDDPRRHVALAVGLGYAADVANHPDIDRFARDQIHRRWLEAARIVLPDLAGWMTAELSRIEVWVLSSERNRAVAQDAPALLAGGAL